MKGDWLHLRFFRGNAFKFLKISMVNILNRYFWRSALNYTSSKLLKFLYWIISGLCFAWKVFKTVNVNLWKSDKPVSKTLGEWKLFGWFVKMWSMRVRYSRFLKEVGCFIKVVRCTKFFQVTLSHFSNKVIYNNKFSYLDEKENQDF